MWRERVRLRGGWWEGWMGGDDGDWGLRVDMKSVVSISLFVFLVFVVGNPHISLGHVRIPKLDNKCRTCARYCCTAVVVSHSIFMRRQMYAPIGYF
jgi:hypothetical protein